MDKFSFVPAIGSAGGIIIGWNNNLFEGNLKFKGSFSLTLEFTNKATRVIWVCTTVYGPNSRLLKKEFWDEIRLSAPHPSLPWVICGDFNSIFDQADKSNRTYHREDIQLAQNLLMDLHLLEPPSFGKHFTCTNGQADPIWVKLDRFLVNANWIKLFPKVLQNCLPRLGSDHVPIRLESGIHIPKLRPFRFEKAWLSASNFLDLIKEWWDAPQLVGCGAFIMAKKIALLRDQLRNWAKVDFGSIKLKKLALLHEIGILDALKESRPLMDEKRGKDNAIKVEMFSIFKQEEIYWKQRARISWLKEGDEILVFFHSVANGRRTRNFISGVWHDNQRAEDTKRIGASFTSFYKNLFGST